MGELADCSVAALSIPLAPIVAQGFGVPVAHPAFLSFPFAFAIALSLTFAPLGSCPILLSEPFWGILVNVSFLPLTGWIAGAVPLYSAAVAALHTRSRLGVSVHDGEARVPFLATRFVHFLSSSFC